MTAIQLCGMIVICIIIYFSFKQKRLRLATNRAYLLNLYTTLLVLIFDILSVLAILYLKDTHRLLVEVLCKVYLILITNEVICGFVYALTDAMIYYKGNNRKYIIGGVITYSFVCATLIAISHMEIVCDISKEVVYTTGVTCTITYISAFLLIITTLLICLIFKDTMVSTRRNAIVTWMLLWMSVAIIQLLNKQLLLVSFGCALGLMIIYLQLENPEKFIDNETGYFNQQAFSTFITQMYRENKEFSLLLICDANTYSRLDMSAQKVKALRNRYTSYLSTHTRLAFLYEHDKVILAFKNKELCKKALDDIIVASKKEFNGSNELLRPMIYSIYDSTLVNSSEALIAILNYSFINLQHKKDKYNHVDITSETLELFNDENKIISTIHKAIKDDRIEVFYQPIYSTKHNKFNSAEALVRIRAEDGSIIPPGVFIDIVERTNLIIKIGQVVFKKVCKFISENNMEELGIDYIEVNLSVIQCAYHSLAMDYIKIIKEYEIDTKYINLEITESASIDSKQILLGNMNRLISHGITFSLDDFGTGQSNLNYIMEMPVSLVKFDKDMISAYFENGKSQFIMQAAMSMIKGIELKIVAEGVETKEQFETLRNLGIDYIQGYYFSKPLPQDEFIRFIKESNNA